MIYFIGVFSIFHYDDFTGNILSSVSTDHNNQIISHISFALTLLQLRLHESIWSITVQIICYPRRRQGRREGGGVWYFGFLRKAEKEKDLFASLAEDKLVPFVAQDRRNFMV